MFETAVLVFQLFFIFLICYAIISDFRTLKIPNWVSLALIGAFAVYAALFWDKIPVTQHLIYALIALVIGFAIFAFGLMGAADIKLITAVVLWAGPTDTLPFIFYMGLVGGAFAILIILIQKMIKYLPALGMNTPIFSRVVKFAERKVIPYGIAIGISALIVIPEAIQKVVVS